MVTYSDLIQTGLLIIEMISLFLRFIELDRKNRR